jgi:hypothetical protein
MKRDILSADEARDQKIAQLTNKHFAARLGALVTGNQDAIRTVDDALSHKFCDADTMGQLIVLAVTDNRQAGAMLAKLIGEVVSSAAEYDAIRDVEQMERERDIQVAEARAEQDVFVRMVMAN